MKKLNISPKVFTLVWVLLIYISALVLIENTSENTSYKNKNAIHDVSAELNFYQSTNNNPYEQELWSSEKAPLETVYEKVKVTLTGEPEPADTGITTVNVTRHSH